MPIDSGQSSLARCLPGVRIVFTDINLQPSAAPLHSQHRVVAAVLDKILHRENGPWVLAAWTASPGQVSELESDLREALGTKRAPLASIALAKSKFQTSKGGFKIAAISKEIRSQLTRDPVVGAIFDFEARAMEAAQEITHSIVELTLHAPQSGTDRSRIASVLKAIAKAASASAPPSPEGVFQTLAPVFEDRLCRKPIRRPERSIWSEAFKAATGPALSPAQTAALNSSLHLDARGGASERGSIYLIPEVHVGVLARLAKAPMNEVMFAHFVQKDKTLKSLREIEKKKEIERQERERMEMEKKGLEKKEIEKRLKENSRVAPNDDELLIQFRATLRWCLLEAAAACDASNDKRGLRRGILGLVIPTALGIQSVAGDHVIALPVMSIGGTVAKIFFSARFSFSPFPGAVSKIRPVGRLRNPMLDVVLQHVSGSQSRLGWISF